MRFLYGTSLVAGGVIRAALTGCSGGLTIAIAVLSIAACGGQSSSIPGSGVRGPTSAMQAAASGPVSTLTGGVPAQTQETVLHNFAGGNDGEYSDAGLTNVNGVFYGTTSEGGDMACYMGCGTVFEITPSGEEKPLYLFREGSDGARPITDLTSIDGVLYGWQPVV